MSHTKNRPHVVAVALTSKLSIGDIVSLAVLAGFLMLVGCGDPGDPKAGQKKQGQQIVQGESFLPQPSPSKDAADVKAAGTGDKTGGDGSDKTGDASNGAAKSGSDVLVGPGTGSDNTGSSEPASTGGNTENGSDPKAGDPDTGVSAGTSNGSETGSSTDPTANAKALQDPDTPAPFVDPNNPDFVPADRTLAKKFDIKKMKLVDGFYDLTFLTLSGYDYPSNIYVPQGEDDPKAKDALKHQDREIPKNILALDGKKVHIKGYMMPIDFEDGGTNEFILTRVVPSCFYCQPPQLNDWVEVRMKEGKRVPYFPDSPIIISGKLEVGEKQEDGFVISLYTMEAVKVEEFEPP